MGQRISRTDFEWVYTEEPHASRRKEILKKYPEIKKLMGYDTTLKYIVLVMMFIQFASCYLIRQLPWLYVIILAYIFGGTINHSLTLAIHEISHNLAFGHCHAWKNRIFEIFVNLPIIIPYSAAFKKYHMDHHRYQGDDILDVDIPCRLETKLFNSTFTKGIWLIFQPFFYALRPILTRPKPLTMLECLNLFTQLSFDILLYYYAGPKAFFYLLGGALMAMGVHPVAGHFISEHYMFAKGYETYSYYGLLNKITFNVGYHMEHHDFPSVPGSKLPMVREIAKEYYENLPCHTSWCKVLFDFVFDRDIGPYSRIKRPTVLDSLTEGKCLKDDSLYPNGDTTKVVKCHGSLDSSAEGKCSMIESLYQNGDITKAVKRPTALNSSAEGKCSTIESLYQNGDITKAVSRSAAIDSSSAEGILFKNQIF